MTHVDEALCAEFRHGLCELCGATVGTQCAHVASRGAGQLDIRENLIALCAACHARQHGEAGQARLVFQVAQREKMKMAEWWKLIHDLRRLPKRTCTPEQMRELILELKREPLG